MRVTIVAEENRVNVEGFSHEVDCSDLGSVHVIQWHGTFGEIEYWHPPGQREVRSNTQFTEYDEVVKPYVDAWEVAARAS